MSVSGFAHTPYDGSKRPFSIGLEPLDLELWLEVDERRLDELGEKARLITLDRDAVFQEEPTSRQAQAETAALIAAFLKEHGVPAFPAPTGDEPPLLAISRQVQEDLCLMQRDATGWRLTAASLCFPSAWSLREKFGLPMADIHGGVPGYPGRMEQLIARMFDNLRVENPVSRQNWSIYGDARLHHPESKSDPHERFPPDSPVHDRAIIRVERQTLRRLPTSDAILFTIRVHLAPMAALKDHPRGGVLAASLRDQLLALTAEQLAYKGLVYARERLAEALAVIAGAPQMPTRPPT